MQFTPFYSPALQGRKRVYISGPMTGIKEYNAPAFNDAAILLRELDYAVCSPTETSDFLGHELSHQEYLRFDFERVLEADFLVALDGWFDSKGARAEILMAIRIGTKVWEWKTWGDYNLITEGMVADAIASARFTGTVSPATPAYSFTEDSDAAWPQPKGDISFVAKDIGTMKTIKEIVGCECDDKFEASRSEFFGDDLSAD